MFYWHYVYFCAQIYNWTRTDCLVRLRYFELHSVSMAQFRSMQSQRTILHWSVINVFWNREIDFIILTRSNTFISNGELIDRSACRLGNILQILMCCFFFKCKYLLARKHGQSTVANRIKVKASRWYEFHVRKEKDVVELFYIWANEFRHRLETTT